MKSKQDNIDRLKHLEGNIVYTKSQISQLRKRLDSLEREHQAIHNEIYKKLFRVRLLDHDYMFYGWHEVEGVYARDKDHAYQLAKKKYRVRDEDLKILQPR